MHTGRPTHARDPSRPRAGEGGVRAPHPGGAVPWTPALRVLAVVVAVLTVLGPAVDVTDDVVPEGPGPARGVLDILTRWLTLDAETSVSTWFSIALLLALASTFAVTAVLHRSAAAPAGRYWLLAAVVLYLSVDESVSVHEEFGRVTGQFVSRADLGTFTWVVPGALLALVVGVLLLRAARGLPPRLRRRLVVAGAVYLGAALLLEALSGTTQEVVCASGACGEAGVDVPYTVIATVEELLEMTGVLLALRAALLQLRLSSGAAGLRLALADADHGPRAV